MKLLEYLLSLIAPFTCVGCGTEGTLLCDTCKHALPVVPSRCYNCNRKTANYRTCAACRPNSPLYEVWAATAYAGAPKRLLHMLKFERAQAAARDIAVVMAARLPQGRVWMVTYVPTAPSRVRTRGYDQARLIAKELAHCLGVPYAPLLARTTSVRQVGHGRAVRRRQMRQAFRATNTARMANAHVLLVDDVITTGATSEAAAQTLRAAGARRVSAAVFAAA